MRVLVTGAAGYIAGQLLPAFRKRYDLVLVDVSDTDRQGNRVPDIVVHDLTDPDLERHRHLFRGVDAVVHLAYYRRPGSGMRERTYQEERVNVDMAHTVYALSVQEGVRRVVMASSNHAADWYEHIIHQGRMDMVYPDTFPLSDNFYGWAKTAYEHMGFVFATGIMGRPLEVVQIRIGAPRELDPARYEGRPRAFLRDLGAYISQRDLQQLFIRSLETPDIRNEHGIPFQIFYGVSNNARRFWSIANARRVIGYEPEDDAELRFGHHLKRILESAEGGTGTG